MSDDLAVDDTPTDPWDSDLLAALEDRFGNSDEGASGVLSETEPPVAQQIASEKLAPDLTDDLPTPVEEQSEELPLLPADDVLEEDAAPSPPPEEDDDSSGTFLVGDREFTAEQADTMAQLYDWVDNMDPGYAQAINQLGTGRYRLVEQGQEIVTSPTEAEADTLPVPELDTSGWDPEVAAVFQQQQEYNKLLAEQIDQMSAQVQQTHAQTERQRASSAATQVLDDIAAEYDLDDEFVTRLASASSGYIEQLRPAYSDPESLYRDALEMTLWRTPTFRNELTNRAEQAAVEQSTATSEMIAEKARRAASANSSSGSVPRTTPQPRTLSRQEKAEAMVEDLQSAISGN
jgi:hypothetical protein